MKKHILLLASFGFLLLGCEQPEQAIVEPQSMVSSENETNSSQAKLDGLTRPDLRISKVVQTESVSIVPDGTWLPLVAVRAAIYITNIGSQTVYASRSNPVTVKYYHRKQTGPVQWGQPINYVFYPLDAYNGSGELITNLAPGATQVISGHIGIDERDLPASKIIQLSCFVDAANRVAEINESNNTEGIWSLDYN